MEPEFFGVAKIKDGLFAGDKFAAQDLDFIVKNKIKYIINTVSHEVTNYWEPIGVKYFSLEWNQEVSSDNSSELAKFIEEGISSGASVLVHSVGGKGRSMFLVGVYLMQRYNWNLVKTIEYLHSRVPCMELKANYIFELRKFEFELLKTKTLSSDWSQTNKDCEEVLTKNTFVNSKTTSYTNPEPKENTSKSVNWTDHTKVLEFHFEESIKNPRKLERPLLSLKSCLKAKKPNLHRHFNFSFDTPKPDKPQTPSSRSMTHKPPKKLLTQKAREPPVIQSSKGSPFIPQPRTPSSPFSLLFANSYFEMTGQTNSRLRTCNNLNIL